MTVDPHRDPQVRAPVKDTRSVPELIGDLLSETTDLFKTEGALIRSEISDKIHQVEVGGGSIAAGAICLLVALFVLAQFLIVALGEVIGDVWAALLVGLSIAAIGAMLLLKGKRDLDPANLTPDRSVRQVKKDGKLVKEQTQ